MTIQGLADRVNKVDLNTAVAEILNDTADQLAAAQREQLDTGIRSDGAIIQPPYSPFTIEEKKKKGQPYDRVTLRDTGDFYSSIKATADKSVIHWNATDWKFEKLQDKYSGKILGLDKEYAGVYTTEVFRPELKQYIESITGLKMT